MKNRDRRICWLTIALVVSAVLMLHPISRSVIYFLLPLGSGSDDYVAIALLVTAAVVLFIKGWTSIPDLFKKGE